MIFRRTTMISSLLGILMLMLVLSAQASIPEEGYSSPASRVPTANTIIDDFEDGDVSDWGFFGGDNAGGGGGAGTDRPYEGSHYFSTGWGAADPSNGFYGGAFKNFDDTMQPTLPANAEFSVWVYNQGNATSTGYNLEITLREDLDGNGWTNGAEDSIRLDTTFTSADYNDQWVQITAPLSDFINLGTGGDGTFNGNLDEIVIVIAGVTGTPGDATVELDFDLFELVAGTPPPVVIDDFNDGDVGDWGFFGGDNAGGGGGAETDRPYEGSHYFSTGWGAADPSNGFYGGAFKNLDDTAQVTPPTDPWLSVWVYNQSNATSDQYTLEITLREDLDGNGWTNGAEDSIRLDTTFTSADYNDRWTRITAPLSDFSNLGTGGDGTFNGNLDEVVLVIAGVQGTPGDATVELDFDLFEFTSGNPVSTPSIAFASSQYNVPEGGTATISVTLSAAASDTITVTYATSDGTATAGVDYTAATGDLVFAAGETLQTFTVPTTDNSDNDDDRTVVLALSNPINANAGLPSSATLTIIDDEMDTPSGKGLIIEDYEDVELVTGEDGDGNVVGYEFFAGGSSTVAITTTQSPPAPVPGSVAGNTVLQEDLFITSGSFSGFSYKFTNESADQWLTQDWSSYAGIGFWLYGNNTGGIIFIDIQDNRNPGSITDDAGRYSIDLSDNFTGWQYFEFMWDEFNRKDIGNGAPNDGFTLDEINGYAFGGFGAQPMDASYYIDDIRLITRVDVIDDFEDGNLPMGQDGTINIGFADFAGNGSAVSLSITDTLPAQVPDAPPSNKAIVVDMTLPQNSFAGYSHAFTNETVDQWVPVNWIGYEGVCFWLYGHNTGGALFFDIIDNRNPDSTADDAERYSVGITDDFSGWQFFQYTWDEFGRKEIGNGAPNDGLTLTEVHGYAFGGFGSVDMGQNQYYLDDVSVWGSSGADAPLTAQFTQSSYDVTEGDTISVTVELSREAMQDVTVDYATAESLAIPDRDFVPVSGTLIIPAGQTTGAFNVVTLAEDKHDGDKPLAVVLKSATVAELGFQRITVLTVVDDDPEFVPLVDDFESHNPFDTAGNISVETEELSDPVRAIRYETVLDVNYDTSGGAASMTRNFSEPMDWSTYNSLTFWFYGTGSGETYTVKLHDNQAATTAETPANEWELVWADEFDGAAGTQPNANDWSYELGDGSLNGIPGWGNAEFQHYTDDPANVSMDGTGNLAITMLELDENATELVCYYGPCRYTSARILTKGKTEFEYGRIEARIQVPSGESGLWPAFWTLGGDIDEVAWPETGEIDIMEYVSRVPNEIFGTIHGPGYNGGAAFGDTYDFGEPVSNEYHTYAIEWTEDEIIWTVDGIQYHQADPTDVAPNPWAFNDDPFFMLLNMAIGGNFGGTISDQLTFPQTMLVDYVRVYQAPDSAERYETTFSDDTAGWVQVSLPFANFTRSIQQPASAPNDGLGLNEVWGYSIEMPEDNLRVVGNFKLAQVVVGEQLETAVGLTTAEIGMEKSISIVVVTLLLVGFTTVFIFRRREV